MGLAGRKDKQRIGADPRNLTWADNAAKFGAQYLSKFGWDASSGSGLGVRGDGMTSHIKVAHKLDLLGIGAGATAKDGKDGVAWKQAREFEILLMRLNQSNEGEGDEGNEVEKEEMGVSEGEDTEVTNDRKRKNKDVDGGGENDAGEEKNDKKKKKRKLASDSESTLVGTGGASVESKAAETREERKARKAEKKRRKEEKVAKAEDKKDKKEKKEKSKERERGTAREASPSSDSSCSTPKTRVEASASNSSSGASTPAVIRAPRPMAHRARFLASKRLALTNASAVSEILGVASSSSSANPSAYPSACATPVPLSGTVSPTGFGEGPSRYGLGSGKLTPATDDADIERDPKMERLTMATKSVAEYFAERMAKKAASTAKGAGTSAVVASSSMKNGDEDMADGERTRVGLVHTSRTALAFGRGGEAGESVTRPGVGMRSGSGLGFKGFAAAASSPLPDIENIGAKEDAKKEVEGERKKKSEKCDKGEKGETKKKRKEKPP